jgi:putative endonuclease
MSALSGGATREAGARCEDLADAYLQRAGLAPIARNFNCRHGELDLVMRDGDVVVFVEVRYRRKGGGGRFGDGFDSVGASKRARLVRAAATFLARHPRLAGRPCRFDVVAVAGDVAAPQLEWLPNAFEAC